MTQISKSRLNKLNNSKYRNAFLRSMVSGLVARQIKILREGRGWTQRELGAQFLEPKPQSTIGRLENPEYGRWSVSTLLELAEVFDVALEVRFVDWPTFVGRTANLSDEVMRVEKWSANAFENADTSTNYAEARVDLGPSSDKIAVLSPRLDGSRQSHLRLVMNNDREEQSNMTTGNQAPLTNFKLAN